MFDPEYEPSQESTVKQETKLTPQPTVIEPLSQSKLNNNSQESTVKQEPKLTPQPTVIEPKEYVVENQPQHNSQESTVKQENKIFSKGVSFMKWLEKTFIKNESKKALGFDPEYEPSEFNNHFPESTVEEEKKITPQPTVIESESQSKFNNNSPESIIEEPPKIIPDPIQKESEFKYQFDDDSQEPIIEKPPKIIQEQIQKKSESKYQFDDDSGESSIEEEKKIPPQPIKKEWGFQPKFGHSAKAEEYALSLATKLDQSGINIDRLNISINGQTVFAMRNGYIDQGRTKISDQQAELMKQALSDPASFQGSMKITQGSKTLLHIKDGKVLIDKVRLVEQSAKVELDTPEPETKQMYERYSQDVKSEGLNKTRETAKNALQDGISREDVTTMLKAQDAGYKMLQKTSGEQLANKSLNKIVTNAISKVKISDNSKKQQEIKQEKANALFM